MSIVELPLNSRVQAPTLDAFLAGVERRAYRMALLATKQPADALDLVQEAMLKLVEHYRGRAANEWPALFQRILQNAILDWHRRQGRRRRWFGFQVQPLQIDDEEAEDPLALIEDPREGDPAALLARADDVETVLRVLEQLPLRQQQAFLLRIWEGFDTAETAQVMGCSEGSVKTHHFRAMQAMRLALGDCDER